MEVQLEACFSLEVDSCGKSVNGKSVLGLLFNNNLNLKNVGRKLNI